MINLQFWGVQPVLPPKFSGTKPIEPAEIIVKIKLDEAGTAQIVVTDGSSCSGWPKVGSKFYNAI